MPGSDTENNTVEKPETGGFIPVHADVDPVDGDENEYIVLSPTEGRGFSVEHQILHEYNAALKSENQSLKQQANNLTNKLEQERLWYNNSINEFRETLRNMTGMMEQIKNASEAHQEKFVAVLTRVSESYEKLSGDIEKSFFSIDTKMAEFGINLKEIEEGISEEHLDAYQSVIMRTDSIRSDIKRSRDLIIEAKGMIAQVAKKPVVSSGMPEPLYPHLDSTTNMAHDQRNR